MLYVFASQGRGPLRMGCGDALARAGRVGWGKYGGPCAPPGCDDDERLRPNPHRPGPRGHARPGALRPARRQSSPPAGAYWHKTLGHKGLPNNAPARSGPGGSGRSPMVPFGSISFRSVPFRSVWLRFVPSGRVEAGWRGRGDGAMAARGVAFFRPIRCAHRPALGRVASSRVPGSPLPVPRSWFPAAPARSLAPCLPVGRQAGRQVSVRAGYAGIVHLRSWFPVPGSLFLVPCCLLPVACCLLPVRGFAAPGSMT